MAATGDRRPRLAGGASAAGVPCAARPATGFRHLDGACQCFFGGPPPAFPAAIDPAGEAATVVLRVATAPLDAAPLAA